MILFLVLVIYFIYGFYLRLESLDVVRINEWVTRDFDRAFNIIDREYFPLAGSESNNGGRLPGPFLYILLSIPLLFNYSYESIFLFNFSLNIASIVMLFFVVRRFFGFYVASFSTILFLINLQHIDSAGFPINPAFIFPMIVLFIWFLLEFSLNKSTKFFPLIVLVLSLAVQLHYSIATYIFVPILIIFIFRIKIPLKSILISIFILLVCFSPYFIYKNKTFEPNVIGSGTFEKQNDHSISNIVSIITAQNTLKRMTFQNGVNKWELFRYNYAFINYLIISVCFYYFLFFVIKNSARKKFQACKKESILLLLFYIPALIYGIANPHKSHQWYNYIFILPVTILIAVFISHLYEFSSQKLHLSLSTLFTLTLIGYFTYYTNFSFHRYVRIIKYQFVDTGTRALSYKNTNYLIRSLMNELKLTGEDYYERVYFDGFSPYSFNRLKFIDDTIADYDKPQRSEASKINKCFYLVDNLIRNVETGKLIWENDKAKVHKDRVSRAEKLFSDKTIQMKSKTPQVLFFRYGSAIGSFLLYQYSTKGNQPCYQNSFNPFVVSKRTRNLLEGSYGLNNHDKAIIIKTLSNEEVYDSNQELNSLKSIFIIYDKFFQTPIRVNITIERRGQKYIIKGGVELYSFTWRPFNINELSLFISRKESSFPVKFDIISRDSWLSENTFTTSYTNNMVWGRKFILPSGFELKKDEFQINLTGSFKTDSPCCRVLAIKNIESSPAAVEVKS